MSGSLVNEDYIARLAVMIRTKNGTNNTYTPAEMSQAILDLNTDGSSEVTAEVNTIVRGTITSLNDSAEHINSVIDYAMSHISTLTTVNLPVCRSIGGYAFYNCNNLTTLTIPSCTTISDHAFDSCVKLSNINDNSLVKVNGLGTYAFNGCTALTQYMTSAGGTVNTGAFYGCTNLAKAEFGTYTYFYNCFQGCTKLASLTLRSDTVCRCDDPTTYFADTKLLTTGTIYVPENLLPMYKIADGWRDIPAARYAAIPLPPPDPDA